MFVGNTDAELAYTYIETVESLSLCNKKLESIKELLNN